MKAFLFLLFCMLSISVLTFGQSTKRPAGPEQEKLNIKGGGSGVPTVRPVAATAPVLPSQDVPSNTPMPKSAATKVLPPTTANLPVSQGTPKDRPLNVAEINRRAAEALKASKQQ